MEPMVGGAIPVRRLALGAVSIVGALALATALVAGLESVVRVPNASAAYLLAVIVLAVALGTGAAVVAAIGSFLAYDFLFVQPVHTFAVVETGEWLNLVLLLVVGLVVGQLAGRQRDRADAAELREREARGLFRVSRVLATAEDTREALEAIVSILRDETRMTRVWIGLAGSTPLERVAADTGLEPAPGAPGRHEFLRRTSGDAPAEWIGLHTAAGTRRSARDPDLAARRIVIEADGRSLGSLWSLRPKALGTPGREETRLLAAAADQVGQAVERDRLRVEATAVEVARRSDALKSALLDSVSHDLRTPLATIRAAAGSLLHDGRGSDGGPPFPGDPSEPAAVIDRQAEYLDRLVTNLLDMSRIEAGALRPELRPILLDDAVADTVGRLGPVAVRRVAGIDIPEALPPVLVDEVYLDAIVANVLENALAYSPAEAPIVVRAVERGTASIRLTIEDGGAGVPAEALDRLFDTFYRVPAAGTGARRGSGMGLAVVRGLAEASGARVGARRSALGGLAIDIDLPTAAESVPRPMPAARGG
jgi:two-component system sensor histidine kinase KdpD